LETSWGIGGVGSSGIIVGELDRILLNKPTTGFMPNGVEFKAERREPSGENHTIFPTFHHSPESLRTSAFIANFKAPPT
jgi:hypothetical protein